MDNVILVPGQFLSTLSLRRATPVRVFIITIIEISIHALLAESDFSTSERLFMPSHYFYPRSPCGERPLSKTIPRGGYINFYPRSPCGERPPVREIIQWEGIFLSTLSLRRATVTVLGIQHRVGISIHALLAESDCAVGVQVGGDVYFYPRSPCGERPTVLTLICPVIAISIHALLAESDLIEFRKLLHPSYFYPRSPCGERLELLPKRLGNTLISIHALLAESDTSSTVIVILRKNFYPRSPCGERPTDMSKRLIECRFLSTLSLRRATLALCSFGGAFGFLSTLSLRRATINAVVH